MAKGGKENPPEGGKDPCHEEKKKCVSEGNRRLLRLALLELREGEGPGKGRQRGDS